MTDWTVALKYNQLMVGIFVTLCSKMDFANAIK